MAPALSPIDPAMLTAIASPRRQEILRLVWRNELAAGEIHAAMPDVSFGAVSLQLARLQAVGMVDVRRVGRERRYQARRAACGPVGRLLEQMWDNALWQLKLQAELEATRRGPRRITIKRKRT
jgi:DNA-binding transcriptional ArsR family regulator